MRSFCFAAWCLLSTASAGFNAPGPAFPAFNLRRDSPGLEHLISRLDEATNEVLRQGKDGDGSWDSSTTSFALQVTSATETLWTSYHSATKQGSEMPHPVTGDTFFRIASISKTFTVYALLLQQLNLDDPVTKWLPELKAQQPDDGLAIAWDTISLRALASHQAGIYRDSGGPCFLWREVLQLHPEWAAELELHGFPTVTVMERDTECRCTRQDLLHAARNAARVFPPNTQPTYSNAGFSLLGAVLESVAGDSYGAIINSTILQPLQMRKTTAQKPEDTEGIIPVQSNDWYKPLDADTATAGLYSTPNDLSIYLRSLLYPATLLPQARLDAWMKPATWTTSGSTTAYGLSWEIYRTTSLTPDHRPIDLVTKAGMLNGYSSIIILVPQLQLAAVILVAGAPQAFGLLRENIISALIPVADEMLHGEAARRYTGYFASTLDPDDPSVSNSSIRLEVDSTGPGLRVLSWTSLGADFLSIYARLQGASPDSDLWQVRLLPSDPDMSPSTVEVWRAVLLLQHDPSHRQRLWDDFHATDIDDLSYAGKALGEFRITIDEKGRAIEVYSVGLRTRLLQVVPKSVPGIQMDGMKQRYLSRLEL